MVYAFAIIYASNIICAVLHSWFPASRHIFAYSKRLSKLSIINCAVLQRLCLLTYIFTSSNALLSSSIFICLNKKGQKNKPPPKEVYFLLYFRNGSFGSFFFGNRCIIFSIYCFAGNYRFNFIAC